jgi:hypothetical protein
MNKNELVKTILKNIQEIYSISGKFENSDELHQIDIDLALSKVRNLYDLLLTIDPKTIHTPQNQDKELLTKPKHVEPIIEEKVEEIVVEPKVTESEPKQEEISLHEPKLEIEKPKGDTLVEKEIEENSKNENSHEIIADKFQSKKFVHNTISGKKTKQDVSTKLQSKPIKDINSAIGINDKFIFIKELFGNNKEHYHETILVLNNFDTFENALEFLNENFDWDSDDPNVERLKELVRRKYS